MVLTWPRLVGPAKAFEALLLQLITSNAPVVHESGGLSRCCLVGIIFDSS